MLQVGVDIHLLTGPPTTKGEGRGGGQTSTVLFSLSVSLPLVQRKFSSLFHPTGTILIEEQSTSPLALLLPDGARNPALHLALLTVQDYEAEGRFSFGVWLEEGRHYQEGFLFY